MVYPKNRKPRPLVEYTCTVCGNKVWSGSNSRKYCDTCVPIERKRTQKDWWLRRREYNRQSQRRNNLKRLYGITVEQYEQLLTKQRGVCAVCGKRNKKIRLHVDHDHVTGKVRGLLCTGCNLSLGRLENKWDKLHEYLGKTQ